MTDSSSQIITDDRYPTTNDRWLVVYMTQSAGRNVLNVQWLRAPFDKRKGIWIIAKNIHNIQLSQGIAPILNILCHVHNAYAFYSKWVFS